MDFLPMIENIKARDWNSTYHSSTLESIVLWSAFQSLSGHPSNHTVPETVAAQDQVGSCYSSTAYHTRLLMSMLVS